MTDGFPDTPGRDATPEEEARVRALLAGLRDDDIPMPDDVWSRLSAVIAQEKASAQVGAAAATALTGADSDDRAGDSPGDRADEAPSPAPGATVSVLPDRAERRRRSTAPRWILGAAAAVVGVALVGGLLKNMPLGSGSSTSAGAMSAPAAASAADLAPVTAERVSNTPYTHGRLATQVSALVSARAAFGNDGAGVGTEGSSASASAGAVDSAATPGTPLAPTTSRSAEATTKTTSGAALLAGAALADCLVQLTGTAGSAAVAVDRGTYEGAPADVVVVPTVGDPASLDVWVLSPGCTATSANVLEFARIARP